MGWMADAKVTMEALAMECKRLRAEVEVANETIDREPPRVSRSARYVRTARSAGAA